MSPSEHKNPPGISELRYRIGTHPDFLQRMKHRLQTQEVADGKRPLAALRADDTTDSTIALLDAWATVADVLTFYQERIAIDTPTLIAFRQPAMLYGHNAPDWRTMPDTIKSAYGGTDKDNWSDFRIQEIIRNRTRIGNQIDLDRTVPEILPESWLVLVEGNRVTPL